MYEVRAYGVRIATFDRPEPALAVVRAILLRDADCEPEVLETRTGRAYEVASSIRWREELASGTIGF